MVGGDREGIRLHVSLQPLSGNHPGNAEGRIHDKHRQQQLPCPRPDARADRDIDRIWPPDHADRSRRG